MALLPRLLQHLNADQEHYWRSEKNRLVNIKAELLGRLTYFESAMYNSSQTVRNAWRFLGDPGRIAKGSNEFMQNVTLTKQKKPNENCVDMTDSILQSLYQLNGDKDYN